MNVIKEREKSKLLKGMDALSRRMSLEPKDKNYYNSLVLGYEGEVFFDRKVKETISKEALYIADLLIDVNGKSAQIDALLITDKCIYVFEIKNYSGEYTYNENDLQNSNGYLISNPVDQLKRSLTLLTQLLKQWNVSIPISGKVVFVNQSFTLFMKEAHDNIILPTQLNSFLVNLNGQANSLSSTSRVIGKRLLNINKKEVLYQKQLPLYNYSELKKGIKCIQCNSFNIMQTQRSCVCQDCRQQMRLSDCILSAIDEYRVLNHQKQLKTVDIYEWSGRKISKYKISNILKSHYKKVGNGQATYYE